MKSIVLIAVAMAPALVSAGIDFFVSTNGNDAWTGKLSAPNPAQTDGPFALIDKARDVIRTLKKAGALREGVIVNVRGGFYYRHEPFELGADDSGAETAPIVYRAYRDEVVRFVGGKRLADFEPVTNDAILSRLDETARGKVQQTKLGSQGITDLGGAVAAGNRPELFFADKPMQLARWPNEGFVPIAEVRGGQPFASHGIRGDKIGKFTYQGDRPKRWLADTDIWLHGYWFWDWSDSFEKVQSIDAAERLISLQPPYHGYGYRNGQRFYAVNLLAELDLPGEWYLDRQTAILYFWPPAPLEDAGPTLSIIPTLARFKDVSHVTLRGMTFEATRGTAVVIEGGSGNLVAGCTIRNTGSWGVSISGGKSNRVVGCDIYQTGEGGISLSGGDRNSLTPARHSAENNHIHNFSRLYRTYRPAVGIQGVGNKIAHNLIHNGPHNGILLGGNEHLIEFNEIHNVCYETGDVGAFYMGRDWTARGTIIRHNFFHHIQGPGLHGAMGVYLDDAASGITVFGNVFFKASRAMFIGGGRDNLVENNIFVDCNPTVHVDARGAGWMKSTVETTLPDRLRAVPYQSPPWSERYPQLLSVLDDEPGLPKGNIIIRNVCWGGKWANIEQIAQPLVKLQDNLIDQDPLFVDAPNLNFQLKDDSPAFGLGFKRIPIEKIGPYKDPLRATWPINDH